MRSVEYSVSWGRREGGRGGREGEREGGRGGRREEGSEGGMDGMKGERQRLGKGAEGRKEGRGE